ncbi:hypothetical protein [Streptomyces sp. NPDC001478]
MTNDDTGGAPRPPGPARPAPGDRTPEALARRARDLTREDRRADRRLLWWELLVLLIIAGLLVARWHWLL